MFGLGWEQIILILLAALFLLGPERIPGAVRWLMDNLRKLRSMASGAQSQMRSQLGPELDELRRQVAELQSLKDMQELRQLRDLDPRRAVGKSLLGDEFSGGVTGFLGLDDAGEATNGNASADSASAGAPDASPAPEQAGAAEAPSGESRAHGGSDGAEHIGRPAPTSEPETGHTAAPPQESTPTGPVDESWLDADIT